MQDEKDEKLFVPHIKYEVIDQYLIERNWRNYTNHQSQRIRYIKYLEYQSNDDKITRTHLVAICMPLNVNMHHGSYEKHVDAVNQIIDSLRIVEVLEGIDTILYELITRSSILYEYETTSSRANQR